jgi:hypothetical protein
MNWIEQPLLVVELCPPAFVHVSVPIDALGSMNAARAWLLTTSARSVAPAPWFQARAHALGECADGAAAAVVTGARTTAAARTSVARTLRTIRHASRRRAAL